MKQWQVEVRVWLKPSVFDPQGNAVEQALVSLGYNGVDQVRIGKSMTLRVTADSQDDAEIKIRQVCDNVLCNPVMETYTFELTEMGQEVTV